MVDKTDTKGINEALAQYYKNLNKYSETPRAIKKIAWELNFVRESNKIEGILRDPLDKELIEFGRFINLTKVEVRDLVQFVNVYQFDARLRDTTSVPGVRVGNHIAPPSGVEILETLQTLLNDVNEGVANTGVTPFDAHCRYETLHPFTDGNGRSGRMLWAWHKRISGQVHHVIDRAFLHQWYYESLQGVRR